MDVYTDIDVGPLAQWLRARADLAVGESVAAVLAGVPSLGELGGAGAAADVAAVSGRTYEVFVSTLSERRPPDPADFGWIAGHAARRVEMGISLADFLKGFRIGQGVLWDNIRTGLSGTPDGQETALAIVAHLMRTIEVLSSEAAEAYVEAAAVRGADDARIERDLLEDLLAGRPPTSEAHRSLMAATGLDPARPYVVGVGRAPVSEQGFARIPQSARVARNALAQQVGGLIVVRRQEVVGVVPAHRRRERTIRTRVEKLVASLAGRGIPLSLGISSVHYDFSDVPEAYREADLARTALGKEVGVKALASLSALDYLVLRPDDSASKLIPKPIRTFVEEDLAADGVFVDTLTKYVAADMNAKAAAAQLHIHVNTVYYRLERIAERTGCDLRRVDDVIDLLLAVRLLTRDQHLKKEVEDA